MFFQTLDDKAECVGIYADGELFFDNFPSELSHTWKPTVSLDWAADLHCAWIYCGGAALMDASPAELKEDLERTSRRFRAYLKSFKIGKINLRQHCFFDLVPADFLMEYCELKNKISQHVFDTREKPKNYDHLLGVQKLLQTIKNRNLNLDSTNCKELFLASSKRSAVNSLLNGSHHVDYNLFGTVTGRLATNPLSFPILTLKKEFRKIIRPHNDWFLSLDYNGAEVRTFLALSEAQQPQHDIHTWNITKIFKNEGITRDEAKTLFFAWLYNPDSNAIISDYYDRDKVLKTWYNEGTVHTPFERHIKVEERKAFNYLIQSTTADLVLERALALDKMLEGRQSFISHIVHDEIVIDLTDEDRQLIPDIKEIFANNKIGTYLVNLKCGKNYLDLKELNL